MHILSAVVQGYERDDPTTAQQYLMIVFGDYTTTVVFAVHKRPQNRVFERRRLHSQTRTYSFVCLLRIADGNNIL